MSLPYIPGFCWKQFLEIFRYDNLKNTYIYMEMLDSFTHIRIYDTYIQFFNHNNTTISNFIDYTNSIKMLVYIHNNSII